MTVNIAINGFGRIGRLAFRLMFGDEEFNIVAVNDLTDAPTLAHLLKYDSNHGAYKLTGVSSEGGDLTVDGKRIKVLAERDPSKLPWGELGADIVLECTGRFTSRDECMAHIAAGAKKVILSAPAKGGGVKTIVYNVNHTVLDGTEEVISGASCTTNCLAPVAKVLDDNFGLASGLMTTIHGYTNDQVILDAAHKDLRRARAAAINIIPTSTGAASAVGEVMPSLKGKLDGIAMRVPIATGSVVDLTCTLSRKVTVQEINDAMVAAANESMAVTWDPIVSSDVIGCDAGSLVDLSLTNVQETDAGQTVKVIAWYDNEMGYTAQLVRLSRFVAE